MRYFFINYNTKINKNIKFYIALFSSQNYKNLQEYEVVGSTGENGITTLSYIIIENKFLGYKKELRNEIILSSSK